MDVTYTEYLRGLRFTFTDIAKMMGISRATFIEDWMMQALIMHAHTPASLTLHLLRWCRV
jgi:phage antirepressor YoqD-like protein